MNYKHYNLDLQVGDIILYRNEFRLFEPVTWLSTAIRGFTQFPYNHAAVVVTLEGRLHLIEALGAGIVIRPLEEHLERNHSKILVLRARNPVDVESFNLKATRALGKKYDYNFTLIAQAWWRLRLMVHKNAKYTGHTLPFADKRFACAEFGAWCHDRDYSFKAAPKELYEDQEYFYTVFEEFKVK